MLFLIFGEVWCGGCLKRCGDIIPKLESSPGPAFALSGILLLSTYMGDLMFILGKSLTFWAK